MRTEFVYSFMALGAIPVVANAADVQSISADVLASTDGSKVEYSVGKLVPGNYTFTANVLSKVYGVTVEIGGQQQVLIDGSTSAQSVNIAFTLTEETDIKLTLVSSDPGESGAEFTVADAKVILDYDFATIKSALIGNADALAGTISDYYYAAKQEDVDAANALKTKANGIGEKYDDYKKFKLYADKSTIQEEIDALAAEAAAKESAYQNDQASDRVNTVIVERKAEYNAAVELIGNTLVDAAAYLKDAALAELNELVNVPITEATQANYASKQAGTAVADEAANKALIPATSVITGITSKYDTQATTNKNAYSTLTGKVTTLQTNLNNISINSALASKFADQKQEAQNAINAIKATVEGVYNKAAQLTQDIDTEVAAAQALISTLESDVATATGEYDANVNTTAAIATLQTNLDNAKTTVNAAKSADSQYEAKNYYADYVAAVQGEIDGLTTAAEEAYANGTAVTYNAALSTTTIQNKIDTYKAQAVAAVAKYDALQEAILGNGLAADDDNYEPGYQKELDDARAQVEGLAIYTDDTYDYKTKFDLIQKRINDIKKAITAAQEKVGADHWTAMENINADADITADIANLLKQVQGDQNTYDQAGLSTTYNGINAKVQTFGTTYSTGDDSKLGDDFQVFADAETAIANDLTAVKTAIDALDVNADATAAAIIALGKQLDEIAARQTALEGVAKEIANKVAPNGSSQSTLATNITTLQGKITTFTNTYHIGTDASKLGNRGKADGSITEDLNTISSALATLKSNNDSFDPTIVTDVDNTNKVDQSINGWKQGEVAHAGADARSTTLDDITFVEQWNAVGVTGRVGTVLTQKLTGLANGVYAVDLYAFAADQTTGNPNVGKTDIAYVYANGVTVPVPVTAGSAANVYSLKAIVSDGTLEIGLAKVKDGTNWNGIQIKSLNYRENSQTETLNGYNKTYTELAAAENELEQAAPGIKTAVENNNTSKGKADTATDGLDTYLDNLKGLADVTNATGEYDGYSNPVSRKAVNGAYWWVYKTGLDADKTFAAEKQAVLDDIAAMKAAIDAANATESLPYPWADEITVTTDGQSTTYKVSAIKAAVDAIKTKADFESKNYWAYRNAVKNNDEGNNGLSKALTNAADGLEAKSGAGALQYYTDLIADYQAQRDDLVKVRMVASLNARTSQETMGDSKKGFIKEIIDLKNLVNAVQDDAAANLAKYNEQKEAAAATNKLYNDTYTEIAAIDHSSQGPEYLKELDAIQVELKAATDAVETSYPSGKAVAEAKDFAALNAKINDVKARQQANYNEFVAQDNNLAHYTFAGVTAEANDVTGEAIKGAIQSAQEVYQQAVQERAAYSSTNADIKAAVDAAAATLDEALYSCPTDIQTLISNESTAFQAAVSPTVFDVSSFNAQALAIEQDITSKLNDFKTAVGGAISDFWTPKKAEFVAKVTDAETAIDSYSDAANADAFKDVTDKIAAGDAAVAAISISDVEAAIAALENIDGLLSADKDAAAVKDINPRIQAAEEKYTEVKEYIESVTNDIPAKAENLQNLEDNYNTNIGAAKALDKTSANRNVIKQYLDMFVENANNYKGYVETAVANDNANTAAYEEVIAEIATVETKLAGAKEAAANYKYATTFATVETQLGDAKATVEAHKAAGSAVANKTADLAAVATVDANIDAALTAAFGTEKTGLSADVTELKNQYNAYVAANGLNETANGFKSDIDALEASLAAAAIADLDNPADGIDFDDIMVASDALIKLQGDIADKETELLAANASGANATVLADFQAQIGELETTASLDDFDEWVGQQTLNGKTLQEQITDLKAQIAEVKAAIEAEANISFYKDQYQSQIDDIKTALDPVAKAITAKDAQFKANAAAYETLSAQITELQGKIDAAKAKVGAYEYAATQYLETYIESYNNQGKLSDGAQYLLNNASNEIETANANKTLDANSEVANKKIIESSVQSYLDQSAYSEISKQHDNLLTLLSDAIDAKYVAEKYSSALWARLLTEKSGINDDITALYQAYYYSYQQNEGSFDQNGSWVYIRDENNNCIVKSCTSDADFAAQMETVAEIKAKIETLSTAVENLALLGDANVDGKVNVLDYQKVANMILDPTLQPEEGNDLFTNIDINQNEVIEVGDLTAVVNYILNGDWQGYAAARGMNAAESESLTMNVSSLENGKRRLAVGLSNVLDYTAFQLDVVLPDGMTIVGASLTDRAGESHKLMSRKQLDGSVRFLASSVAGESFKGSEGAVLYIDVEGTGNAQLLNILFSDLQSGTHAFSLKGEATGIDALSALESLKQTVYDLGGRVKNTLKKGINIIRRADGSTQKVVK